MRICILINRRLLGWHEVLAERLGKAGHDVCFGRVDDGPLDWHPTARFLIELEALLLPGAGVELLREVAAGVCPPATELCNSGSFDIVIQCARSEVPQISASRILIPQFDGGPDETGALLALLDQRSFSIGIKERVAGQWRETSYVPALDGSLSIAKSLSAVCSRMGELLLDFVGGSPPCGAANARQEAACPSRSIGAGTVVQYAASALKSKIARRIAEFVRKGSGWAIAWRAISGDGPFAISTASTADYSLVRNDSSCYLADPFPFVHQSKSYLFAEDFDYASGRGRICVLTLEDGAFVNKTVVLDQPYHLSYPMVFTHGADIWMIPETGAAGRVELYRAESFPLKWVREAVLLDGINAYDATLHIDGSGCWLFCSTSSWGASTSDRLELFHAPQLLGPWRPCPAETRVFDARIARPAGKLFRDKARLIRPAQDCSRIYGGAIQLCGVERLSEAKFTQTLISRLEPEDQSLFWGCHTYNTHGAIETIDVFGYSHARREVTLRKKSAREAHTVHARVAGALV